MYYNIKGILYNQDLFSVKGLYILNLIIKNIKEISYIY